MFSCPPAVERLARYSVRWTDSFAEPKIKRYGWKDRTEWLALYDVGDAVEFQNAFGAWVPHTFECDVDVRAERVVDVRAAPGRLP